MMVVMAAAVHLLQGGLHFALADRSHRRCRRSWRTALATSASSAVRRTDVACSGDVGLARSGPSPSVCKNFAEHIGDTMIQLRRDGAAIARHGQAAACRAAQRGSPTCVPSVPHAAGTGLVVRRREGRRDPLDPHRGVMRPIASVRPPAASSSAAAPAASSSRSSVCHVELRTGRTLGQGADIVVHSAIHPVVGPEYSSGMPPPIFFRQSTGSALGAMV